MADITKADVLEWVKNAPALELAELVEEMEEVFGVSAAAPVAVAAAGAPGGGDAPAEEKDSFDVVLTGAGEKKIQVIKAVRGLTSLGLKEAKDVVEGVPSTVIEGASKEDGEKAVAEIEEAGGTAELK